MYKGHGFGENLVSVVVSTFLIFMFVDQLLLVDVFSQLHYLTYAKKQQCRAYRYKSLKSWKIDIVDLTQQFSSSIFTYFRYRFRYKNHLIAIDFYRLTTPGIFTIKVFSLLPAIYFELPITRTFFDFPWRFELSGVDNVYSTDIRFWVRIVRHFTENI